MKILRTVSTVVISICSIAGQKILNIDSLFKNAKCEGNNVYLQKHDNTWSTFPCSPGYKCESSNGNVQCVPDESAIKISTVTITLPGNISPTVTIKHPTSDPMPAAQTGPSSFSDKSVQISTPEPSASPQGQTNLSTNNKQNTPMDGQTPDQKKPSTYDTVWGQDKMQGNSTPTTTSYTPQASNTLNTGGYPALPHNNNSLNAQTLQSISAPETSLPQIITQDGNNIIIEYKDNGTGNIDFKIPSAKPTESPSTPQVTPGEFSRITMGTDTGSLNKQGAPPVSPANPELSGSIGAETVSTQAASAGKPGKASKPPSAAPSKPAASSGSKGTKSSSSKPAASGKPASSSSSSTGTKSASPSPSGSPGTGSTTLTADLVKKTLSACGYSGSPNQDFVNELISQINKTSWDSNEKSMFLAQIYHESAGLTALVEQACVSTPCTNYDNADKSSGPVAGSPGKHYYGRGYIQLTWPANYQDASKSIYKDDRLYTNPDQVATDKSIAAAVSIWYWNTKVMTSKSPLSNFGETTKAINGAIECQGSPNSAATNRWNNYLAIAKIFSVNPTASSKGCGNS
ncbi:hypothetical protein NEAUS03_1283 [Nematocida ausubeli]|nr:hypothetical protein NEAUS03_1283 [Nematocida ausubeli]